MPVVCYLDLNIESPSFTMKTSPSPSFRVKSYRSDPSKVSLDWKTRRQAQGKKIVVHNQRETQMASEGKPIYSPISVAYYPSLAAIMISIGLFVTASFFIYEATSTKKTRSFTKELAAGAVASVFLGFGSLFLLLASGVYV